MPDVRIVVSVVAIVIGFIGYYPYFRDIFQKKTKPHAFSWFIWTVLTGMAFFAQIAGGGGVGAWVTGVTALLCLVIAALALFVGEKRITRSDWVCLIGAILGIVAWIFTSDPMWAVVIITVVDFLGFIPTFRKAYARPYEETVTTYIASSIKFGLSMLALEMFSLTTLLYPASLVVTNLAFAFVVITRRATLKKV